MTPSGTLHGKAAGGRAKLTTGRIDGQRIVASSDVDAVRHDGRMSQGLGVWQPDYLFHWRDWIGAALQRKPRCTLLSLPYHEPEHEPLAAAGCSSPLTNGGVNEGKKKKLEVKRGGEDRRLQVTQEWRCGHGMEC